MQRTTISTNILVQMLTDNELVAIVKYQSLWALLEYQPDDKTALRYMTNKQLMIAKSYIDSIEKLVTSDIDNAMNKRRRDKKSYEKQRDMKNSDVLEKNNEKNMGENKDKKEKIPHTPLKEIKISPKGDTKSFPEDFTKCRSAYPKQRAGNRDKAYTAYCRVLKERRATSSELLASVQKYAGSEEVARGYAKGFAAWLNDDRFLVDYGENNGVKENPFHVQIPRCVND